MKQYSHPVMQSCKNPHLGSRYVLLTLVFHRHSLLLTPDFSVSVTQQLSALVVTGKETKNIREKPQHTASFTL